MILAEVEQLEFIYESNGTRGRVRRTSSKPEVSGFPVRWDVFRQSGWVKIQNHEQIENEYIVFKMCPREEISLSFITNNNNNNKILKTKREYKKKVTKPEKDNQ